MRMTTKLYTCFVDFKKQKSISSTKKTPLQYPNLDRFPSLQGHIYRPVALCSSNSGKLDRQVDLESITTWMEVYNAHSHHKPLSTYRQDCAFTLCSIPRARLQHGIEILEKMKRYSTCGFFAIERVDCRTLVEFCYPRQGYRSQLYRSSAVAEVGCSLLNSSHGHHQSCRRYHVQGRGCLLYWARSFVSGDISAGICA